MDLAHTNFSDLGPSKKFISIKKIYHGSLRIQNEYCSVWTPSIGEELVAKHESLNAFDKYEIAAKKYMYYQRPPVVGNVPW